MCALGMNSSSNLQITVICGRTSRSSRNGGITQYLHIQISRRETSLSKMARLQLSLIGSQRVGILSTGSILDGQLANYNSPHMWQDLRDNVLDPYPDELEVDEYLGTVFTRL